MRWLLNARPIITRPGGRNAVHRGSPKRWEPMVNAIVVRVLAGNGDGVGAGALATRPRGRVALLLAGSSTKRRLRRRLRRQKSPGRSLIGRAMVSPQAGLAAREAAAAVCHRSMVCRQVVSGEMSRPAALGFPRAPALKVFFAAGRGQPRFESVPPLFGLHHVGSRAASRDLATSALACQRVAQQCAE
jgi:hypothetical protein